MLNIFMAIYVASHKLCFIHNPKTGGSSIQHWLFTNTECVQPKKTLHCGIQTALEYFPDIAISFVVVRNPWDWCVSWYHYQKQRALHKIDYIKNNSKLNLKKDKYNLSVQKKVLEYLDLGFENWLINTNHKPQTNYTKDVDIILKLENIDNDFKQIQNILNVHTPLPHLNTTDRDNYSVYYNSNTIDIVYNKYKDDIKTFGYKYETP